MSDVDPPLEPPGPAADPVEHREFRERLREAALEAERATGEREDTEAEARAKVTTRIARMTAGSLVLVLGAILLPLPGPGWVVIALGLGILSKDVAWAERTLDRVRRRLPEGDDGNISKPVLYGSIAFAACTMAVSVWWSFLR
jgi:uncharacterized protein (TIGR02611 family)